jgi:hypothetical protein
MVKNGNMIVVLCDSCKQPQTQYVVVDKTQYCFMCYTILTDPKNIRMIARVHGKDIDVTHLYAANPAHNLRW